MPRNRKPTSKRKILSAMGKAGVYDSFFLAKSKISPSRLENQATTFSRGVRSTWISKTRKRK